MTLTRPAMLTSAVGVVITASFWATSSWNLQTDIPSDSFVENSLVAELDGVSGNDRQHETDMRLMRIEKVLRPMFRALSKNTDGVVGHAAASYVLHRVFLQRHGWSITSLEPTDGSFSSWSAKSPMSILEEAPEEISRRFEQHFGKNSFDLVDLSHLALAFEDVVHREALLRLSASYIAHSMKKSDILMESEVIQILDTFMAIYIMGNGADTTATQAKQLRANINESFPAWAETQEFVRDVFSSVAPKRDYLYFSEVEKLLVDISERYGEFQNKECREFKDLLVAVEDQGVGGAGRVRLADFYNMSLNGKWQFSEQKDYLELLGALDDSDASNPRVIIPNYINSYANCAAASSHYRVCCLDECESIFATLEQTIAAPEASPSTIIEAINEISGGSALAPWLHERLNEVASIHNGQVPLHGRLFAQWLHYVYPRECQFPPVPDLTKPQHREEMERHPDAGQASKEVMEQIVAAAPPRQLKTVSDFEADAKEASPMWTLDEELVVWHTKAWYGQLLWIFVLAYENGRECMLALTIGSFAIAVASSLKSATGAIDECQKKCYEL